MPSLPSWECGLKFSAADGHIGVNLVAPPAGAWIEISLKINCASFTSSLPPRERGLKYLGNPDSDKENHQRIRHRFSSTLLTGLQTEIPLYPNHRLSHLHLPSARHMPAMDRKSVVLQPVSHAQRSERWKQTAVDCL